MSFTIKNAAVLLLSGIILNAGCTRRAVFPGLENAEGVLTADDKNAVYDDSAELAAVKAKSVQLRKPTKSKDLSRPNPDVYETETHHADIVIPSKRTPVVIEDMDLLEMDAADKKVADNKVKTVKPVSKSKMLIATKKEQRPLKAENKNNETSEPSVFYLAETIYFNNGGSVVDSSYFSRLRKIVREAKAHNGRIIVQGFASSRTRNTDVVSHKMANLKVSAARADNVAALLIKYGMPKNLVLTEGLSDSRPAYKEVMPEGERLNRRAEIYISY